MKAVLDRALLHLSVVSIMMTCSTSFLSTLKRYSRFTGTSPSQYYLSLSNDRERGREGRGTERGGGGKERGGGGERKRERVISV